MSEHEQICNLLADIISAQAETTEAITKLMEAIGGLRTSANGAIKETKAIIEKAKAEPAAPAPSPTAAPPSAAPEAAAPDFETAKKALMSIPSDRARAILKGLGVAKLSELDASKYGEVIEACRG